MNARIFQTTRVFQTGAAQQMRDRRQEAAFTLTELLVVILIVGILAAVAIPTFLGGRNSAADRAAQANLRNAAMGAARGCDGTDAEIAACLSEKEPAFTYTPDASSGPRVISFQRSPVPQVAVLSESGTCWAARLQGRQLRYGGGVVPECRASALDSASIGGANFDNATELAEE